MSSEQEPVLRTLPFTGIYISLVDRAVEFENEEGTIARIDFSGETVLVAGEPLLLGTQTTAEAKRPAQSQVEQREKQPLTRVSGKLMTQPKEGKADSRGKPTAWARLAVHEEGREDARLYSATFHRHTASIALGLPKGASITAEGYAHDHAGDGAKRMDTFSVINLVAFPGKQENRRR